MDIFLKSLQIDRVAESLVPEITAEDAIKAVEHAHKGEQFIPVKYEPGESWEFVFHKHGVHLNLDGNICAGKCTVMAVF